MFPPEVLGIICGHSRICSFMTKADLEDICLVCKFLEQATVPFLVHEIYFLLAIHDLERTNVVASLLPYT